MDEELFYGATLDKAGASVTWHFNETGEDQQGPLCKLYVKQILLGHTAKEGEYNVVEVETMSSSDVLKIPVAVLKVGETRSVLTNLEFPDAPVTFKLVEGSGPVYIHGNQIPVYMENVEDEMEDEAEAVEEEPEEEMKPASKKRKLPENGTSKDKATNGSSATHKSNKKSVK